MEGNNLHCLSKLSPWVLALLALPNQPIPSPLSHLSEEVLTLEAGPLLKAPSSEDRLSLSKEEAPSLEDKNLHKLKEPLEQQLQPPHLSSQDNLHLLEELNLNKHNKALFLEVKHPNNLNPAFSVEANPVSLHFLEEEEHQEELCLELHRAKQLPHLSLEGRPLPFKLPLRF